MPKHYALKLRRDMKIAGEDFCADEQIGVITCEINPHDLLGLVQHGHAELIEVTDEGDESFDDGESDSESLEVENDSPSLVEDAADLAAIEEAKAEGEYSPMGEFLEELVSEQSPEAAAQSELTSAQSVALFVADGLEEKIAHPLVAANGIKTPDALRSMMSDPSFDLIDLHEIGDVRAKKIMAVYLK